jgi:hypothetical protein
LVLVVARTPDWNQDFRGRAGPTREPGRSGPRRQATPEVQAHPQPDVLVAIAGMVVVAIRTTEVVGIIVVPRATAHHTGGSASPTTFGMATTGVARPKSKKNAGALRAPQRVKV